MQNSKRTVTCGELRKSDVGKKVVLNGWVSRTRDLGGLIFIRLRDRYGITQVMVGDNASDDVKKIAKLEKYGVKGAIVGKALYTEDFVPPGIIGKQILIYDDYAYYVDPDTEDLIKTIEQSDSIEAKDKLEKCMKRLQALGNKYNAAEGIVVVRKGRRFKFTGSFAAINGALGTRFMIEN